ncbi:hypothetical protein MSAN_01994500 [Mycena sanguinolenta]|uniref:Uncharacterized protein n=1 Tax=Mycena sanguinolenta TaxID=230812 RepID=A0A8H7CM53_9AGAR|nr:hypothetical protein MSAN_01994500 [Mycena sanguinolenta]
MRRGRMAVTQPSYLYTRTTDFLRAWSLPWMGGAIRVDEDERACGHRRSQVLLSSDAIDTKSSERLLRRCATPAAWGYTTALVLARVHAAGALTIPSPCIPSSIESTGPMSASGPRASPSSRPRTDALYSHRSVTRPPSSITSFPRVAASCPATLQCAAAGVRTLDGHADCGTSRGRHRYAGRSGWDDDLRDTRRRSQNTHVAFALAASVTRSLHRHRATPPQDRCHVITLVALRVRYRCRCCEGGDSELHVAAFVTVVDCWTAPSSSAMPSSNPQTHAIFTYTHDVYVLSMRTRSSGAHWASGEALSCKRGGRGILLLSPGGEAGTALRPFQFLASEEEYESNPRGIVAQSYPSPCPSAVTTSSRIIFPRHCPLLLPVITSGNQSAGLYDPGVQESRSLSPRSIAFSIRRDTRGAPAKQRAWVSLFRLPTRYVLPQLDAATEAALVFDALPVRTPAASFDTVAFIPVPDFRLTKEILRVTSSTSTKVCTLRSITAYIVDTRLTLTSVAEGMYCGYVEICAHPPTSPRSRPRQHRQLRGAGGTGGVIAEASCRNVDLKALLVVRSRLPSRIGLRRRAPPSSSSSSSRLASSPSPPPCPIPTSTSPQLSAHAPHPPSEVTPPALSQVTQYMSSLRLEEGQRLPLHVLRATRMPYCCRSQFQSPARRGGEVVEPAAMITTAV